MQQAARVSDRTAFMLAGELVEVAPTDAMFTTPRDPRTEAYITGTVRMTRGRLPTAAGATRRRGRRSRARSTPSDFSFWYGKKQALLRHRPRRSRRARVTALIGPSGCGKSTFLRSINRMNDADSRARGTTARSRSTARTSTSAAMDVVALRQRVGMVFQRWNPFPEVDLRQRRLRPAHQRRRVARASSTRSSRSSLRRAALWDEVKDRLRESALGLSGGQQQRLCIARALANEPEVLLLDEPASALDPIATQKVEELLYELKRELTIVIVTHNLQQAARVSDRTAFFYLGRLVEVGTDRADLHQPARTSAPRRTSPGDSDDRRTRQPTRLSPLSRPARAAQAAAARHVRAAEALRRPRGRRAARAATPARPRRSSPATASSTRWRSRSRQRAIELLALQQPMARDLRFIIGAIKVSSDLERVGDHAVNIAQCAQRLVASSTIDHARSRDRGHGAARARDARATRSTRSSAPTARSAATSAARDDEVDALHDSVFRILLTHMMEDAARRSRRRSSCFLVSRNLERVADLATNIGEDAVFLAEGKQIKHHAEEAGAGRQRGGESAS